MGLGYGQPPPDGYRVASDEHGNSIDPFSGAERAAMRKAAEEAKQGEIEARREAKESGAETFTPMPLHGEPGDILDAAVLAVAAEPWRMHSAAPGGELNMDTPEAKRQRERQRLDEQRAKVEQTIARVSGEPDEDAEVEAEYQKWVRKGLSPDPTDEDLEDEEYARQEAALEAELEAEAGWEEG
jgi:hypothetical protein